jgi:hypothetical protein
MYWGKRYGCSDRNTWFLDDQTELLVFAMTACVAYTIGQCALRHPPRRAIMGIANAIDQFADHEVRCVRTFF